MDDNPFKGYNTGVDFWHDTVLSHGIDEALIISRNYLGTQLVSKPSNEEQQFCRALFMAMFEAASKFDPTKIVYSYDLETASERTETSYYHTNRNINEDCARRIDQALQDAQYANNYCNSESAAMKVILDFGFNRVCAVLAHQIQRNEYDDRYSRANEEWANTITLVNESFCFLNSHACLIDSLTTNVRELYGVMDAERFALPGLEEYSTTVHGYKIIRSIMVDDKQGYAIGHNPDAVSPWVCWQFYIRDGERSYNWGTYGDEQAAKDNYNARIFVAFN